MAVFIGFFALMGYKNLVANTAVARCNIPGFVGFATNQIEAIHTSVGV
jgi:hypothetical protein